jgi:hypothetical protein
MPVKVKFTLEQAMKAQRGSRGIDVFLYVWCLIGWVVNATPRPLSPGNACLNVRIILTLIFKELVVRVRTEILCLKTGQQWAVCDIVVVGGGVY